MGVLAVTIYPTEVQKRDQLLIATACKALTLGSKPRIEIEADWLKVLLDAPPLDKIMGDAGAYAGSSWMAGELILFMISAALHHPELDITLTKGVWVLPKVLGGGETWDGGVFSAAPRTVWKAWSRFKSVAHLHAVRQIWLQDRNRQAGPDMEGFSKLQMDKVLEYLAFSEAIRRQAVERRIIRHEDTWRSPESLVLPSVTLEIPPLPQPALDELAKYRPEYSKDAELEDH